VTKLINDQNEIYDVVDKMDQVVGQATRREIHQKNLLHRSIHILVFNFQNEVFLQKRSMAKDENLVYGILLRRVMSMQEKLIMTVHIVSYGKNLA
jgi:hypothetical protein